MDRKAFHAEKLECDAIWKMNKMLNVYFMGANTTYTSLHLTAFTISAAIWKHSIHYEGQFSIFILIFLNMLFSCLTLSLLFSLCFLFSLLPVTGVIVVDQTDHLTAVSVRVWWSNWHPNVQGSLRTALRMDSRKDLACDHTTYHIPAVTEEKGRGLRQKYHILYCIVPLADLWWHIDSVLEICDAHMLSNLRTKG